ncbi:hypothetical protein ACLB2K_014155 [Fragaria x ananassa]
MVKEYSHLEFRCDLLKFGRLMTVEIRENVTELKLQLLDRTPFRSLFRAYYEQRVIESACRKSDIDIVAVLKCFDKGKNAFTFGEISGTISVENIADIFGLNVEGREINLNQKKRKGDSEFIKRQFSGDKRLSKVILEKKIKDVAKLRGLKNESDFVRLVCLYFCVTLFFCNSGNDLSWFIVPYIEDLESMSLYAWAPAVKNYLDTSLRGMNGWPESACGCLIALLFWFCERTRFIEPITTRGEMKPTFLKWNLLELYARMKVVDLHELKEFEQTQSPSAVEIPNKEKNGLETTGSEEEGSEEKCEDDIDTSKMFQLLPSQDYPYDIEPGLSSSDAMDKRLDELASLLKNEQARNEILCNENKRLESKIEMLRRSKNLVKVEKQTSRTLRSRSECKKPSFLVDYITENSRKGKGKIQVVNNNDDDDFVQSSPKKKKVPSVGQNIDVRRHRVGKCMVAPYAQKLKGYLAKGDRMSPKWGGVKTGVRFEDVLAIWNECAVSVQAIDLYVEILSQRQHEDGEPMCLFLPTLGMWFVLMNLDNGRDITTELVEAHCETFFDNVWKKDFVFLPVMHKKHQHYTFVDSGICVMYIMKQLSEDGGLESTFPKDAMAHQRAHVLERFLDHIISG